MKNPSQRRKEPSAHQKRSTRGGDGEGAPVKTGASELRTWMESLRTLRLSMGGIPEGFSYAGMEDFLLQHGVWFEPAPRPRKYPLGARRSCFGNAIVLAAIWGLRYVEGLAIPAGVGLPVHHAWNLDSHGRLIDNTWELPGQAYCGVEFAWGRAARALWDNDGTVLDDIASNFEVFRHPWKGEDAARQWEINPKLKSLLGEVAAVWKIPRGDKVELRNPASY